MMQIAAFKSHSRRLARRHARLSRSDSSGHLAQEWRERTSAALVDAFFDVCDREGIRTLIECGAHEAAASVRFVRSGSGRRAIALEANPFVFAELTTKAADHGVEVLQRAVGAGQGVAVLNIPASNVGDEAVTSKASLGINRKWDAKGISAREVSVEVITLDELLADRSVSDQVALWVDVEGYAADVLEGARSLLLSGRVTTAIVEVESSEVWSGGRGVDVVTALLHEGGLLPVARDHQFGSKAIFNVLFVHRSVDLRTRSIRRGIETTSMR